ncbi:amino acid ABC transporter permease [Mesorhizobium koreense]|jgi:polar amino acid transport system permease protein|uniref:amino acid ABC transporter permease n=1 Tax=Mesorhizobium koreense TaxID=3074855 RepID=UPI00287B9559|nr:amino acid ABC transporter permease [Mesorhizobium sp. WR6]
MDILDTITFFGRFVLLNAPKLQDGVVITIWIAVLALPASVVSGAIFAASKLAPFWPVRWVTIAIVEFLRNTPLLLQMFFLYFGSPLLGWRISGFACGVIAIAIQHGAFFSDVIISGLRSVSPVQVEAGKALGMPRSVIMRDILLPQAALRILAPTGNQLIIAVKDTAIVSAIGVVDLTLSGKILTESTGASFEIFIMIGSVYVLLSIIIGYLVARLEKWAEPRVA